MTPEDNKNLEDIGRSVVSSVIVLIVVSCFYGILVVLVAISTYIQFRKGLKAIGARLVTALTLALFATSTAYWIAQITDTFMLIQGTLFGGYRNINMELLQRYLETSMNLADINRANVWLYDFNLILSDAVVVWRTCVLWGNRKKLTILPLVLMTATLVAALVNGVMYSIGNNTISDLVGETSSEPAAEAISQLPVVSLSLATNIASTALIYHKARIHRRFTKNFVEHKFRQSAPERIVLLLVESGVFYCCFQLIILILAILNLTLYYSDNYVVWYRTIKSIVKSMAMISAIYPTLIIVLVNTKRSLADLPGMVTAGTNNTRTTTTPIEFSNDSLRQTTFSTTRRTSNDAEHAV